MLQGFHHQHPRLCQWDDAESTFERTHCSTVISHSSWSAHLGHTVRAMDVERCQLFQAGPTETAAHERSEVGCVYGLGRLNAQP